MSKRRWRIAFVAAVVALAATAVPTGRLRHLAIPLIHDPSVRPCTAFMAIADDDGRAVERARLPGRVSAILPRGDGGVLVGTFDSGLWRVDLAHHRAPVEVGALDGRERFVDALAEWDGHVVIGTHRGAILLSGDGARAGTLAAGQAVSSLVVDGDELYIGTAHGVWRGRGDAPLGERGPDGETLRVTALATANDRLWIGTPDGVYSLAQPATRAAAWHPLVFGASAASSNVVTALVPFAGGVLAGTDDGGTVFVGDGGVVARPFGERRANDVNPGALAHVAGAAFVGTEGAGLITVDETGARAHRLGGTSDARISAVTAVARPSSRRSPAGLPSPAAVQLWFGSEDGALYSLDLPAARPVT